MIWDGMVFPEQHARLFPKQRREIIQIIQRSQGTCFQHIQYRQFKCLKTGVPHASLIPHEVITQAQGFPNSCVDCHVLTVIAIEAALYKHAVTCTDFHDELEFLL